MVLSTRKALAVTAVVSDVVAVLVIALAAANVFTKIKKNQKLNQPVYIAITWEHNILIPASMGLLTGTFLSIYLILSETTDNETINPL